MYTYIYIYMYIHRKRRLLACFSGLKYLSVSCIGPAKILTYRRCYLGQGRPKASWDQDLVFEAEGFMMVHVAFMV